jgi:hypothetical protein
MSSHVYYKAYKKIPKEKIKDEDVPVRIKTLLKNGSTGDTKVFLESLLNYYESYGGVTTKQYNALQDIESAAAERMTTEHKEWIEEYDEEKRKIAVICAKYYDDNPPYYGTLVKNVLTDKTFVPTKKQFKSMCDNEYTKKVLLATFSESVYAPGAFVQGRKNAPKEIKDKCCVVVTSNDRAVIHAAQGVKTYLVLPIGESQPVECEERHLKKFRKKA